MTKSDEIKQLINELNEASLAYYQEAREIMSNFEYDEKYDRLLALEKETGILFANSPTQNVGYEVVSQLPKERHPSPMLSLDKTKEVSALKDFLGSQKALLSWKLDGLTVVLTYENGKLEKAVTRGNGEIGEIITNNAKTFINLPLSIPFKGRLVVRGEAVIGYKAFEKINNEIEAEEDKYKNPRNLCSGSVRQLDSSITAKRNVQVFPFALVEAEGYDFNNSRKAQFDFMSQQGFQVVEHVLVDSDSVEAEVENFRHKIENNDNPSDGLVLVLEDLAYSASLGRTAKFPRDAFAFKWQDEIKETTLREIEWSPSRTGLINPVAIFDPIELEGTTVSRASVHNISIVKELQLGIGDRITVYKANMIIPQIAENLTKSNNLEIPNKCPTCGGEALIKKDSDTETLVCTNIDCPIKKLKSFAHLVSRDALNVDGLSEETLDKFLEKGFLKTYKDLYHLDSFKNQIILMDGFGEKSYNNLQTSLETSRKTNLVRFLFGLGINGIGLANSKVICKHFNYNFNSIKKATKEELLLIDGVGEILAEEIISFFKNEKNKKNADDLAAELTFEEMNLGGSKELEGKGFVITGTLVTYPNRKALQEKIESLGGKVIGSVSAKTSYLINNDILSTSSKNKKAKELGIPIITEEDFNRMIEQE